MAIDFITQPDEAANRLFRFVVDNPTEFPADMREHILEHLAPGKSISFAVSEAAEMIFARKSELSNEVIKLGAVLAMTAAHNKINNFADDDGKRGYAIATALRRHSGEKAPIGVNWPVKEEDPSPKDVYLPPPDADGPVPAPEPSGNI